MALQEMRKVLLPESVLFARDVADGLPIRESVTKFRVLIRQSQTMMLDVSREARRY